MHKIVVSMALLLTLGLLIAGCGRSQGPETGALRIAYLNAEAAFSVFLNAVKDLREQAAEKETEIVLLQQQYQRGALSKEEFEAKNGQLQIELLQANLKINFEALIKMIASDDFADMRAYLRQMKVAAEPIVEQANELVMAVEVGAMDIKELEARYAQIMTAYRQFEQTLTQSALQKIYQVAEEIAEENGYDLVLRAKDVIVYLNEDKIEDITDLVKDKVSTYL
jgi:Skp family chaperone for outer membrane proteins